MAKSSSMKLFKTINNNKNNNIYDFMTKKTTLSGKNQLKIL